MLVTFRGLTNERAGCPFDERISGRPRDDLRYEPGEGTCEALDGFEVKQFPSRTRRTLVDDITLCTDGIPRELVESDRKWQFASA